MHSTWCIFIVYSIAYKGIVCYDDVANHFRISQNVVFFDNWQYFQQNVVVSFDLAPLINFEDDFNILNWVWYITDDDP